MAMSSSTQQGNNYHHQLRGQLYHRSSRPEQDVCTWLRDEPMDTSAASSFLHSDSAGRNFVGSPSGSGGADGKYAEIGGSHRGCVADESDSPGYTSDLVSEEAAQRKGMCGTAQLFAQLRATKIKESVILEGIQRLGGGQKGLRGVVRAILFWLESRHRHNSQSGELSNTSHPEFLSGRLEDTDEFSLSSLDCGSVVDGRGGQGGVQHFGNLHDHRLGNLGHSSPADFSRLVSSSSSGRDDGESLCDLRSEYSHLHPNYDCQQQAQPQLHAVFIGEPDRTVGGGSQSQRNSGATAALKDMSRSDWVPPMRECEAVKQEKAHRAKMIRKFSPSPDRSGAHCPHDLVSYDDTLSHQQQSKIRRHSPIRAGYSSSQSSTSEFSYLSPTAEVLGTPGIFCAVGANPFAPGGPFSITPSSPPPDPHSLDFNVAFGTQGQVLLDDAVGTLGSSIHGCGLIDRLGSLGFPLSPESVVDRKQPESGSSGTRLGASVVGKSKGGSPAASTRLARKQRMERNRKGAYQVNRGAFETSPLIPGKSGGVCSPGSLRSICRPQGRPASDRPTCRTIDRKDQENLKFLLLKVLRPSDVGNLGRIVLPKKDAESHLPSLCAREGIPFACEDYDTGEIMTLRYRFWPNNKSRMYLLENTGDFIKKHRLQESDRMLMYRNQLQGTYIIRARKAQDCVDSLPSLARSEDMEGEMKEILEQSSPGGTCSSGTSSLSGTESGVPVRTIVTSQDDLLNFADLPDAPMGEGTENLVRFPSLESFDVELLDLAPSGAAKEEDVTSCAIDRKEE